MRSDLRGLNEFSNQYLFDNEYEEKKDYEREDGFISHVDAIEIIEKDPRLTEEQRERILEKEYDSLRKSIADRLDLDAGPSKELLECGWEE